MSFLCVPFGADAVRYYRFLNVPIEKKVYDKNPDDKLVLWLAKMGLQWDGYWTNTWSKEAQAIAMMMQQHDVPVYVDVDDHFEQVPTGNHSFPSWFWEKKKLYRAMLYHADHRVASTPFLADRHDAKLAPNFVDPEQWDYPKRPKKDDSCVLLHCGSVNRAEDYLQKEEVFRAFLRLPNTKIVFMGWMPKWAEEYEPGRVVYCNWVKYKDPKWGFKYHRMMRWIAPDIVASPLEHNDFNLAKSNIKWLESAMMGACFVGEKWGELERTVEDTQTGYLCDSLSDWTDTLTTLAQNEKMRTSASINARSVVESHWTWGAVGRLWRAALGG